MFVHKQEFKCMFSINRYSILIDWSILLYHRFFFLLSNSNISVQVWIANGRYPLLYTTFQENTANGALLGTLRMNKIFDYSSELTDEKARDIVEDTFSHFFTKIQPKLAARNAKRFKEGKLTFQYLEPEWLTNSIHV